MASDDEGKKKSFIISLRKKTCTAQTRWCATFRYWVILNTVVYQSKNIFVNFSFSCVHLAGKSSVGHTVCHDSMVDRIAASLFENDWLS